jgi:hypothetical protein
VSFRASGRIVGGAPDHERDLQGEDILLVSAFAGHAKTSTTVDVYSHVLPRRAHEAARRMRSVSLALGAATEDGELA